MAILPDCKNCEGILKSLERLLMAELQKTVDEKARLERTIALAIDMVNSCDKQGVPRETIINAIRQVLELSYAKTHETIEKEISPSFYENSQIC